MMYEVECILETRDLLHIGSGTLTSGIRRVLGVQKLKGQPFIPGSTLRGKLRANLETILDATRAKSTGPLRELLDNYTNNEIVLNLFGGPDREGRVVVSNGILKENIPTNEVPGIRLDYSSRSIATGALFFHEMVPSGAEFIFKVYIDIPAEMHKRFGDSEYLLVLLALRQMEYSGLGRHRARVQIRSDAFEVDFQNLVEAMISNE